MVDSSQVKRCEKDEADRITDIYDCLGLLLTKGLASGTAEMERGESSSSRLLDDVGMVELYGEPTMEKDDRAKDSFSRDIAAATSNNGDEEETNVNDSHEEHTIADGSDDGDVSTDGDYLEARDFGDSVVGSASGDPQVGLVGQEANTSCNLDRSNVRECTEITTRYPFGEDYITGVLIVRGPVRHCFHRYMAESVVIETDPKSDLPRRFAFELFDRYGFLKREWQDHVVNKGSGVFGEELGQNDFILIGDLYVKSVRCGKSMERTLFNGMVREALQLNPSVRFVFVLPEALKVAGDDSQSESAEDSSSECANYDSQAGSLERMIKFWRAIGFRRVGLSDWFCFAVDKQHACRTFAEGEDPDPPFPRTDPDEDERDDANDLRVPFYQVVRKAGSDDETVAYLENITAHTLIDNAWKTTSTAGDSLLHLVASQCKPRSIAWFLKCSVGSELKTHRNNTGHTPLEALLDGIEMARGEARINQKYVFVLPDETIQSLIQLREISDPSATTIEQIKHCCTCGQCLRGVLSPRTRERLVFRAKNLVEDRKSIARSRWTHGREDLAEYSDPICEKGIGYFVERIGHTLRDGTLPEARKAWEWAVQADVRSQRGKDMRKYLQAGWTICTAFRYLVTVQQIAMFDGDPDKEIAGFRSLPRCANDDEYEGVRKFCV